MHSPRTKSLTCLWWIVDAFVSAYVFLRLLTLFFLFYLQIFYSVWAQRLWSCCVADFRNGQPSRVWVGRVHVFHFKKNSTPHIWCTKWYFRQSIHSKNEHIVKRQRKKLTQSAHNEVCVCLWMAKPNYECFISFMAREKSGGRRFKVEWARKSNKNKLMYEKPTASALQCNRLALFDVDCNRTADSHLFCVSCGCCSQAYKSIKSCWRWYGPVLVNHFVNFTPLIKIALCVAWQWLGKMHKNAHKTMPKPPRQNTSLCKEAIW